MARRGAPGGLQGGWGGSRTKGARKHKPGPHGTQFDVSPGGFLMPKPDDPKRAVTLPTFSPQPLEATMIPDNWRAFAASVLPPQEFARATSAEDPIDAPRWRYGMRSRPPHIGAVPQGFIAVEPTIPHEEHASRHGVLVYASPLSDEQVKSYELIPVSTDSDPARDIADSVLHYAAERNLGDNLLRMAERSEDSFVKQVGRTFANLLERQGKPIPIYLAGAYDDLVRSAATTILDHLRADDASYAPEPEPTPPPAPKLVADAGDPVFLRTFAKAAYTGSALLPHELAQALAAGGIRSDVTRKKIMRDLQDPHTGGSKLYDVDDVAAWVRANREKTRTAAQKRKAKGGPVRSTKLIAEALQWAKYSDDGRYPTIAELYNTATWSRAGHKRGMKDARHAHERKAARAELERAYRAEDSLVERYQAWQAKQEPRAAPEPAPEQPPALPPGFDGFTVAATPSPEPVNEQAARIVADRLRVERGGSPITFKLGRRTIEIFDDGYANVTADAPMGPHGRYRVVQISPAPNRIKYGLLYITPALSPQNVNVALYTVKNAANDPGRKVGETQVRTADIYRQKFKGGDTFPMKEHTAKPAKVAKVWPITGKVQSWFELELPEYADDDSDFATLQEHFDRATWTLRIPDDVDQGQAMFEALVKGELMAMDNKSLAASAEERRVNGYFERSLSALSRRVGDAVKTLEAEVVKNGG